MLKEFTGAILLTLALSSPSLAKEYELVAELKDSQLLQPITQEHYSALSASMPEEATAELLSDLLTAGKFDLALDLATYYFPSRDENGKSKAFYKIISAIAQHYLGEEEASQADFAEVRQLTGLKTSDKELADSIILPSRTIGNESSRSLGIYFFPKYDNADNILRYINNSLHELDYRAINQAASFAIQVKQYADIPEFYLKRGLARWHLGKKEEATKDFQKAKVLYYQSGTMKERRQADWIIDKFALN